jgi:AcrR family transcriptional regulator
MTQRKYQMRQRAAAVEETRKRILEATSACHRERGMLSTGMEDVAERAGVAIGTVYRHFPTLEHLIGACGAVFMTRFALPDPDEVPGLFRGSRTREARLTRLIDEVTTRYQGGAIGFIRIREAKDELEPAAAAHETVERSLDALAAEAARPFSYSPERRRALRALLDARVRQSLIDHGLDAEQAADVLRRLAVAT